MTDCPGRPHRSGLRPRGLECERAAHAGVGRQGRVGRRLRLGRGQRRRPRVWRAGRARRSGRERRHRHGDRRNRHPGWKRRPLGGRAGELRLSKHRGRRSAGEQLTVGRPNRQLVQLWRGRRGHAHDLHGGAGGHTHNPLAPPTGESGPPLASDAAGAGLPVSIPDDNPLGASSSVFVAERGGSRTSTCASPSSTTPGRGSRDRADRPGRHHGGVGRAPGRAGQPHRQPNTGAVENQAFVNTVFDDEAVPSIGSGSEPYTGSFKPQRDQLSRFDGKDRRGTWTLRVRDLFEGDTGTLRAWGLTSRKAVCDFDSVPPETSIAAAPGSPVAQSSASFEFSSADTSAGFECRLDGTAYEPCTSPKSYGLASTTHTFEVRAVDGSGNEDPSPASHSWAVDVTPPETVITGGPSGTVGSSEASFVFSSEPEPSSSASSTAPASPRARRRGPTRPSPSGGTCSASGRAMRLGTWIPPGEPLLERRPRGPTRAGPGAGAGGAGHERSAVRTPRGACGVRVVVLGERHGVGVGADGAAARDRGEPAGALGPTGATGPQLGTGPRRWHREPRGPAEPRAPRLAIARLRHARPPGPGEPGRERDGLHADGERAPSRAARTGAARRPAVWAACSESCGLAGSASVSRREARRLGLSVRAARRGSPWRLDGRVAGRGERAPSCVCGAPPAPGCPEPPE